jgi:glycine cleavage system transcriptional repressor
MSHWNLLTLVGDDRPGIVAQVTRSLYQIGCNLGEASMLRLGNNFTIMLMVRSEESGAAVLAALAPVTTALGLQVHCHPVAGGVQRHVLPNFQVCVSGADRAGIVADVTAILAAQGFNILALESDVAGVATEPLYMMDIQGFCAASLTTLETALAPLIARGVSVTVAPVDVMIG